jgi:hypothetical protein
MPVTHQGIEMVTAYPPAGTKDRIRAVLRRGESLSSFGRDAILNELDQREKEVAGA